MKRIITRTLVIVSLSVPLTASAGYGWHGGYHHNGGGNNNGNNVPIDGGLSLLAAAGIGYAAKKRLSRKIMKH